MTWEAFVDLAAALDVGLLYTATRMFTFDDLDDLDLDERDDDARGELRSLQQEAERHAGQLGEIELCFAHQGVRHLWSVAQPWLQPLVDRTDALRSRVVARDGGGRRSGAARGAA